VTRDVYGKATNVACWNHPEYRAWWNATVIDLFRTYNLDGFQWGAERMGPLMNAILPWNDAAPTCFCEHCVARGRAKGVDPERARTGFEELHVYVHGLMAGKPKAASGVFAGFVGIIRGNTNTDRGARRCRRICTARSRRSSRPPTWAGMWTISPPVGISSTAPK
jgi:hypothetical protein